MVYNTGLNDEEPIPFEGSIKASYCLIRCRCDNTITYECNKFDDFPFYEFICYTEDGMLNFARHCVLNNLFYYDIQGI